MGITVKTLSKSGLSEEEVGDVISLIDIESFCDLIESVYIKYLQENKESINSIPPGEYFLSKIPEQIRIWEQTNIESLIEAIKEGY